MDAVTISNVWLKGKIVSGYDPNIYRKDDYGWWMERKEYGNRQSQYGWEIDHIIPSSKGGSDNITNLRQLNWYNNAKRQDDITK